MNPVTLLASLPPEVDAQLSLEAEAKIRAETEAKIRAEVEANIHEMEARILAEVKAYAEVNAKIQAATEARIRAEAEAQVTEAEARIRAAEARIRGVAAVKLLETSELKILLNSLISSAHNNMSSHQRLTERLWSMDDLPPELCLLPESLKDAIIAAVMAFQSHTRETKVTERSGTIEKSNSVHNLWKEIISAIRNCSFGCDTERDALRVVYEWPIFCAHELCKTSLLP
jgi:multidrug efflux pump subunit AcrA (membrane-fusion protein)